MISLAHLPRTVALAIVVAELWACGDVNDNARGADERTASYTAGQIGAVRPVAPADSERVALAETAFLQWLASSAEPGATANAGMSESNTPVSHCNDGGSFPTPLLATWQLLPSQMRGDTVVVHAIVTTVGEQDEDRREAHRFTARQRVRTDILEWDMIETADGWMVCNGIQFGYVGADSLTSWLPSGTSIATARGIADSLRKLSPQKSAR